ncbi:hypothetical protein [Yoonia litorea]|uniref:hypothetical protein n=1 Tax=Yoonia litorea TaxID=1123755 RepID=UPI0010426B4F|nr:hypothetical protein [Yoonia litorea]
MSTSAYAQETAQIDQELAQGIDFRSVAYSGCLDQFECTVGDITIVGQRRLNENSAWVSAPLYWDPIDGFGIQDGAQNDEIDIDERLLVRFADPVALDRIWLSDLFVSEDRRYGSSQTDLVVGEPEDAEIAGLTFLIDGAELANITVAGESRLPWAQFNQEVDTRFQENGDLRRRIVVNDDIVTVVIPGADITLQTPVTENDRAKQGLFDGLETVELDISDLLAEFNNAALFEVGTNNFELINAIAANPESLSTLIRIAQEKRTTIQLSNGEVGFDVDPTMMLNEIAFFSPFDASNDFSIAGVILGE